MKSEEILDKNIASICESLLYSDSNKWNELGEKIILRFKEGYLDIESPESFSILLRSQIEEVLSCIIVKMNGDVANREVLNKIIFCYLNYTFIESNIEGVITMLEGGICSGDKTSTVIEAYIEYLKTENIDNEYTKGSYFPKVGLVSEWMILCDSLMGLYYGKAEKYIKIYTKILGREQ